MVKQIRPSWKPSVIDENTSRKWMLTDRLGICRQKLIEIDRNSTTKIDRKSKYRSTLNRIWRKWFATEDAWQALTQTVRHRVHVTDFEEMVRQRGFAARNWHERFATKVEKWHTAKWSVIQGGSLMATDVNGSLQTFTDRHRQKCHPECLR